jgi:hypothetical protein
MGKVCVPMVLAPAHPVLITGGYSGSPDPGDGTGVRPHGAGASVPSPISVPLNGGDGRESPISDATLRNYNIAGCVLHFVQGTVMLVASQVVQNIKDFKQDITFAFLEFDEDTQGLVPGSRLAFGWEIGLAAAIFVLLSAAAHGLVLIFWDTYIADINRGINRARWYEYSISSSIMICSIAILFGCYDLGSLLLMFFVNAVMNLQGLLMEVMNPPERRSTDWRPFVYGCIAGVAPWIVVCMYFFGGGNYSRIPGFVYGILGGYFVFFNTFPINMILQYSRVGAWADYRHGEKVYIILSLVSKSLLTWLVFGGTFQPNGN